MPTGLTAKIHDGEEESVTSFLKRVALHSLGYSRRGKDTLPTRHKVPEYYIDSVYKDIKKLRELESRTDEEWREEYNNYLKDRQDRKRERMAKNERLEKRYDYFIDRLEEWDEPEHMNRIKEFALRQLRNSKDHDVVNTTGVPMHRSAEEYKASQIEHRKKMLKQSCDMLKRQVEVSTKNNRVLRTLHNLDLYDL